MFRVSSLFLCSQFPALSDILKGPKMRPQHSVPSDLEPNHEARLLFFRLLNAEWPTLQQSLVAKVLPAYRACWREAPATPFPRRDRIRKGGFEAPITICRWSKLRYSRRHVDLRRALYEWASEVGRGLQLDWILDSALATLEQYCPTPPAYDSEVLARARATGDEKLIRFITTLSERDALPWRYGHQKYGGAWGAVFEPKFVGTIAHPDEPPRWLPGHDWYFGTMDQFRRRMRNQFERELSRYCRNINKHWSLTKGGHVRYARWTIARLSGLTWPQVIARFPELKKYSEPETQAKKRVREFLAELDPTLAKFADRKN
jgi:hypothetical protein